MRLKCYNNIGLNFESDDVGKELGTYLLYEYVDCSKPLHLTTPKYILSLYQNSWFIFHSF